MSKYREIVIIKSSSKFNYTIYIVYSLLLKFQNFRPIFSFVSNLLVKNLWVPCWAIHCAGSHLASEVVLVEFTKPKRHGYQMRSLLVKKNQHRLTRRVTKCPKLRANCVNCKQTAPTTSYLGYRKATQFCRWSRLYLVL